MSRRYEEFKTYVHEEFISHLPFTVIGVFFGLLSAIVAVALMGVAFGEEEYHMAHFAHIFFSAAAGAAIFKSYRNSVLKAVPVAIISALLLCVLSDALIPFVGLKLFGYDAHIHLCAVEHPLWVVVFLLGGAIFGLIGIRFFSHCNRSFHLMHLLISTAATTLFMLMQIGGFELRMLPAIGCTLFFALAIPCLVGDMVLPLCFVHIDDEYLHEKVHHYKSD